MLHNYQRKHLFKIKTEIKNFRRKTRKKKTKESNNQTLKSSKPSKSYKWYLRQRTQPNIILSYHGKSKVDYFNNVWTGKN